MNERRGLTLAEVLIALAVIGIAFAALAMTQVTNLRSSVISRTASETKAAANVALERIMAEVVTTAPGATEASRLYAFNNYYWQCPDVWGTTLGTSALPGGVAYLYSPSEFASELAERCGGDGEPANDVFGGALAGFDVDVFFTVVAESGVLGEGVLTVVVTAEHRRTEQTITIGDRVTCYDVYPSPTATAPEPCPVPTATGGGR